MEKAPPLSDICTALKGEILLQDFFHNLNTLILWYKQIANISTKQTTRILNFYQITKHTSDGTEAENVNERIAQNNI